MSAATDLESTSTDVGFTSHSTSTEPTSATSFEPSWIHLLVFFVVVLIVCFLVIVVLSVAILLRFVQKCPTNQRRGVDGEL